MSSIIVICPVFYGYEKTIYKTVKCKGKYEKVYFFPDCPTGNLGTFSVIKNVFPMLSNYLLKRHNRKIFDIAVKECVNTILIIRGEFIQCDIIEEIKKHVPQCKIVDYQWDSIERSSNALKLLDIADVAYSFDYKDVDKYPQLQYLSLFSSWNECGYVVNSTKKEFDLLHLGGNRNDRVALINKFKNICKKNSLNYYIFCHERFASYIKNRKKLIIDREDLHFFSISYRKYFQLLQKSRVILDIASPQQSGLTMRTFESLDLGVKIVTTNTYIKREPFYNEDYIYIIEDINNLNEDSIAKFIKTTPISSCPKVITLTEWLYRLGVL